MEKKELTDEEIIKAYKCCIVDDLDCSVCPCDSWGCAIGNDDILDLIHRLQNDIAKKDIELERARNAINERDEWYAEQKAENERLTEEKNELLDELIDKRGKMDKAQQEVYIYQDKNAELQKQVDELDREKEDLYFQNKNLQTYIDNHETIWKRNTEQAVKDTAKEIYGWLKEHTFGGAGWELVKTYFREKGVEVE